ncbi:MAG: Integrase, catalytic region [Rhizobium sp.]|nr:Integrase, catalytic region [Rhizobium sp.]
MTTIDIKPGEIFDLPDGRFRFLEEWDDETLWFIKSTGARLPMTERELVELMGVGLAKRIDIFKRSDGRPASVRDLGPFGPGEEHSPEAVRARTLQFFVREWDKAPSSLGRKGLQNFIDGFKGDKRLGLLHHEVHPSALYNAIVKCGESGNRPLHVFRSMRGKVERKRFGKVVEEALNEAVDHYWSMRSRNYTDAYGLFRTKMKVAGVDPKAFPRRMETLRRRINRTTNWENWARKYSPREATLKFEGVKDSLSAERPLDLVIMDHTVIDTFVVFDNEHFLPLGRPTLTVAIDVATRMVLGYLISFEPPSLYSVLTTLKRVNRSKSYMSLLFPTVSGVWDGYGLPKTILVDSAWEFKAPSLQNAARDTGTEIIWSPVRTPQYKAIGERFFKTLNDRLFKKLPGGVPTGPTEMRLIDVEPRENAVINLGVLDELMHETIVGYHAEFHDGIDDLPERVWERKIKMYGRKIINDIDALDKILSRRATVRLTRSGITFNHMKFHDRVKTSKLLDDLTGKAKRRDQPKSAVGSARCWVDITWDPIDASKIQVWNDGAKPPRFVTLPNRDRQFVKMPPGIHLQRDARVEFTRPLSFWHAEKVRIFAKESSLPFELDEQKWVARNKLMVKWEKAAGLLPMREHRDSIRGLAQTQGQFDVPPRPMDGAMDGSDVLMAVAEPSPSGMNKATLVPQQIAAYEREESERNATGKPQTAKTKAKIRRNKREKEKAAADARAEAATEAAKERARAASARQKADRAKPEPKHPTVKAGKAKGAPKPGDPDIDLDDFLDEK